MHGNIKPPPTPTEEQALSYVTEALRSPQGIGKNSYDVYLPALVDRYIRTRTTVPQGVSIDDHIEALAGPFFAAVWSLCRLGVLRPGPQRPDSYGQFRGEAIGYCFTEFGRKWIAESPPFLPTHPSAATDMLHAVGKNFGDAYMLRSREAVLSYNGQAYFACCAMVGASAEAILLATACKKLGEADATKIYVSGNGRSRIQSRLLGQQPDWLRTQFESHTDLIAYWRDQAAHGHQTGITESEAYSALGRLLRFAHFVTDNWNELTT